MPYVGAQVSVPLGQLGLFTDEPMSLIPPNAAIKAHNIALYGSRIEKAKGSTRYSDVSLGSPVVAVHDWWPTPTQQRMIAATASGRLWKDTGDRTWSTATPIALPGGATDLGALTPDVMFVEGGAEQTGRANKLFFFSGNRQIQVLSGDQAITTNIAKPSVDWTTGNFPTGGIIYGSRLCVWGVPSNPHRIYFSNVSDHEDFDASLAISAANGVETANIFSGEGEGIIGAAVYKGLLLLFKRPYGIFIYNRQRTDESPQILKYSDTFALASPHSVLFALDDLLGASATGSLASLKATEAYGSLELSDTFAHARIRNHLREVFHPAGHRWTHSLYYPEKLTAYFTYRSHVSSSPAPFGSQNRMLVMDMSMQVPRFSIETKDQPTCLALRLDENRIARPIYGANDGFVYLMDQEKRNVGGLPYISEFQTPHIDFSYVDQGLTDKIKLFDFLSITYQSAGTSPFFIDVIADGRYVETLTYQQRQSDAFFRLDSSRLDVDALTESSEFPVTTQRLPLHCSGRTISLRIYNNNLNESFRVERCTIGFRVGGERSVGV